MKCNDTSVFSFSNHFARTPSLTLALITNHTGGMDQNEGTVILFHCTTVSDTETKKEVSIPCCVGVPYDPKCTTNAQWWCLSGTSRRSGPAQKLKRRRGGGGRGGEREKAQSTKNKEKKVSVLSSRLPLPLPLSPFRHIFARPVLLVVRHFCLFAVLQQTRMVFRCLKFSAS